MTHPLVSAFHRIADTEQFDVMSGDEYINMIVMCTDLMASTVVPEFFVGFYNYTKPGKIGIWIWDNTFGSGGTYLTPDMVEYYKAAGATNSKVSR